MNKYIFNQFVYPLIRVHKRAAVAVISRERARPVLMAYARSSLMTIRDLIYEIAGELRRIDRPRSANGARWNFHWFRDAPSAKRARSAFSTQLKFVSSHFFLLHISPIVTANTTFYNTCTYLRYLQKHVKSHITSDQINFQPLPLHSENHVVVCASALLWHVRIITWTQITSIFIIYDEV